MVSLDHERLLRHIDEHHNSYLERWEQFHAPFIKHLKHQTDQIQQATKAPTMSDRLQLQLQSRGIHTALLNNDSSFIYGELDNGASHTLLFSQYYTANLPAIWELLPIASWLIALDVYRECTGTVPVNIKWLLHGSEKVDASDLHSIVEEHRQQLQADGCLWSRPLTAEESILWPIVDNIPLLFLGTRGLLCVELNAHITTNPVPSHYGSIAPNAAWRLLWALNSLKDAHEEILIEGFYDTSSPIEDEALSSLYTLPDTAPTLARQWGMKELLLGLQGFQMHYAHLLTPTCTINFLTGGNEIGSPFAPSFPLQIPSQARAQVDFYLIPGQEPEDIFARLQHHLHSQGFSDIQTRLLYRCPPAYTPLADSFVQLVCDATTRAYGHKPLILPMQSEAHPLSLLQHITSMPILITSAGIAQPASQQWDHHDVASSLIRGLKQTALIINTLGRT
jgi:acetylornithine deacetylase/succinyl-diaminopimelate desuccinylase-like protein